MPAGVSVINTADPWLNTLRGGGTGSDFTAPAVQAVQLYVADPGPAGLSGAAVGDTSRKAITYSPASGGSMALSSTPPVWTNSGTAEHLAFIGVWSGTTGGNFQYSGPLANPQNWGRGNTFTLTTLIVSMSPLAA